MSRVGALAAVLALAVVAPLALGCKRAADPAPSGRPPPIPPEEASLGRAACDDLVARVCACATAQPDRPELRERCELDRARPEALALALETAARPDLATDAVLGAQRSVRTIIDKCVTAVAALPSLGC